MNKEDAEDAVKSLMDLYDEIHADIKREGLSAPEGDLRALKELFTLMTFKLIKITDSIDSLIIIKENSIGNNN
jgi:hypothetical protein